MKQDASTEAIQRAFRRLSKERHPDKNRNDTERATRDYQELTRAKIVLLDAEKRRKHDEELIDSGVRNEKALPLLCSICMSHYAQNEAVGKSSCRCLKGFGHRSPLIDEFHAAQQDYHVRVYSHFNQNQSKAEFTTCLEQELQKFLKNEWLMLYPLTKAPDDKEKQQRKQVIETLKQSDTSSANKENVKTKTPFLPTTKDAVKVLQDSLLRRTRCRDGFVPSTDQFPMYDLSSLSDQELRLLMDYLRLPNEQSSTREMIESKVSLFLPSVVVANTEVDSQTQNTSGKCKRCSTLLSLTGYFFTSFVLCFGCYKVYCQNCMKESKCKIPSTGSFTLRNICLECFTSMEKQAAQKWLEHGRCLLESNEGKMDTAIAMYMISNTMFPTDKSIISQAEALYVMKEHTRLIEFGKEVVQKTALAKDNRKLLVYYVAESLMEIAHATDKTDLMKKAGMYEETTQWIERFDIDDDKIHEVKLMATRMKLNCHVEHDQAVQNRSIEVFSQLKEAIQEGSFLKALVIQENEDKQVMHLCFQKLLKESSEKYNEYSKLLLHLFKAIAHHEEGNSTAALNVVADVFWNGYSLFQAREHIVSIVEYVIQFILKMLKEVASLPLENISKMKAGNFLRTLQLTEEDLVNPPDIDQRKWKNLTVHGCDMKMFFRYETAVKKLVQKHKWSPLDAAFAYYDLFSACKHPAQLLITLITSSQWFARQISCSDVDEPCLFACKKMITKLTNLAAALAFEFSTHPYMQYYVAKLVIGLQFYSSWKTGYEGQETANFIGVHMKWLVAAGRHCPLHKIPIVAPAEAVLMNIITTKLHCQYLLKLQDFTPEELRPMSEAILRYQIYENCWFQRGDVNSPTDDGLRLTAMTELLAEKKWSWDDVQRRLLSNMIAIDRNGWKIVNGKLLGSVATNNIQKLVGLEINKKDFTINVLVEKSSQQPPLLSLGDIASGVSLEEPASFFSLEAIDPQQTPYHPFNKLIFSPEKLEGTEFLFTMLHTDYLLKQFSMGFEIQYLPPFQLRPMSEGLLKGLPNKLKKALSSIPSRGASRNRVHRLWIQADTMEYDVQEDNDTIRWLFGKVKMTVRCMPMFHDVDGELKDQDTNGPDPDSPEGRFVADFNTNYDKIGKQFPSFLRLKELCKVQWLGKFLNSFQDSLESQKSSVERGELDSEIRRMRTSALEEIQAKIVTNLNKMRNDIKQQVPYINDTIVNQVHQQGSISASYQEISDWLYYGDSHVIANRTARECAPTLSEIRKKTIQHHKANLEKYTKAVRDVRKCATSFLSASNNCMWIPTVNYHKNENEYSRFHYGGVSLTPKLVKRNFSKPGFFSGYRKIVLTPSTFSSHKTAKQQPTQTFNPPKVMAKKASGTQQSLFNSGSAGDSWTGKN